MIAPEAVEKLLQNPVVRILAGFGFLLLVNGVVNSVLFNLADGAGLWDSLFRRAVWRIGWIALFSMVITAGLWVLLSVTRKYDQAYWLIVVAGFIGWVLLVVPIGTYLPDLLQSMLSLVANGTRAAAVLLAFVTLDKAIPRLSEVVGGAPAVAATVQPQATATQAAGWYPDPRGETDWRWWDGAGWTENTS